MKMLWDNLFFVIWLALVAILATWAVLNCTFGVRWR